MGRAPCCDKANVKKGPWSPDEDAKLKAFIDEKGTGGNWITLPSKAGLKRCGKSCRLRWINYLRPDIKHGSFTEEEERMIYKLHSSIGSRWSLIAAQLPGRTDNDIKNYWNTRLKKKLSERKLEHQSSNLSNTKFPRASPPHDRYANEKMDDAMLTNITAPPSCQQGTGALNDMSSAARDSLISQFLKPQHQQFPTFAELHEASVAREASSTAASPLMTSIQQQVGVVKSEVQVVPAAIVGAVAGDGGGEVNEQLLRIECSLRSCISSHPSPASSCSGISTDRSTYAPAQCAESPYNTTECLSSVYQEQEQQNNNGMEDSDVLLPVISSVASPTLLVHSSVQSEERGALEFGSRLADVGGLVVDDMTRLFVQEEESSHQGSKSFLSGGVKTEEYSFDRFDCNWWSSLMVNPSQKQTPTERTFIAAAPPKLQQQHQQQMQQQFMQLQIQEHHNRYGESLIPTQLSLDNSMPCYMKPPSWNPTPSSCNGNVSMSGSLHDYGIYHHQNRHGSWDSVNWAETR